VWRLYARGLATLRELEEWYSVDDVINANDVLDIEDEAAEQAMPKYPVTT